MVVSDRLLATTAGHAPFHKTFVPPFEMRDMNNAQSEGNRTSLTSHLTANFY